MQLVLNTNGLVLSKRNKSFYVRTKEHSRTISPYRIRSIAVTADCLISHAAVALATQHGIPIVFHNRVGRAHTRTYSAEFTNIHTIHKRQTLFSYTPDATRWIIGLFEMKLQYQIQNLKYLADKRRGMKTDINRTIEQISKFAEGFKAYHDALLQDCSNNLMGIEGKIAQQYWQTVSAALPKQYQFGKRSRRPAVDPFNAVLNYLYGMMYGVVGSAVHAAALDPYCGFLHADQYNAPTFVFDMIEPFRPWVDKLLIETCMTEKLLLSHCTKDKAGAVRLNKKGKEYFIPQFNDTMQIKKRIDQRQLTARNHIYRLAGEFAQRLLHDKVQYTVTKTENTNE